MCQDISRIVGYQDAPVRGVFVPNTGAFRKRHGKKRKNK